jgi:hypothetical protein
MNKKAILSWLSLVVLVATSAHVPAAAGNMITSVTDSASSLGSSENVVGLRPEVRRVGVVVAYSPGQSITIADRQGNEFTFELASLLKIVPAHRADLLAVGAFVTIIAPNNVPNGKHIAVGIVIHRGVPPGFAGPSGPGGPPAQNPPTVFPPPKTPLIPTQRKPTILDQSTWSPPQPLRPILAYTFPSGFSNWTIPLRAAAFVDITPDPSERFTPVGMVEVGANPETESESSLYLVNIDLNSTETEVQGQLVPVTPTGILSAAATDTLDVTFQRIPQRLNPERINSPYEAFQGLPSPQNSMATIFADGVCFVIKVANGTGNGTDGDSDDDSDNGTDNDTNANNSTNGGPIYNYYCSKPSGPDEPDAPLSIMDNFPTHYAELQDLISGVAGQFGLQDLIQMDEIISTRESILGIQDCASTLTEEACGSDIIAALVTEQYFEQQFREKFGGNGDGGDEENRNNENGENNESQTVSTDTASVAVDNNNGENDDHSPPLTPIEVAVVKVLKPIETPNTIVQPGDYRMDFWFDSNGLFFAATLTGMTTDNIQVTNQQIPGVPATFIDQSSEGPHQPALQISAKKCNIFGRSWCVWWEDC